MCWCDRVYDVYMKWCGAFLWRRGRPTIPRPPILSNTHIPHTQQEGNNPDGPGEWGNKGDEYQSLALQRLSVDFPFLPLPKLREWLAQKGGGAYFKVCGVCGVLAVLCVRALLGEMTGVHFCMHPSMTAPHMQCSHAQPLGTGGPKGDRAGRHVQTRALRGAWGAERGKGTLAAF